MNSLLLLELAAILIAATAELVGVTRKKRGKVDTYSEIVWRIRDRLGLWFLPIAVGMVAFVAWVVPHLLFEG
jgi:hypothetical protein